MYQILQILLSTNFKYDPTKTSQTKSALETLVRASILSFDDTELSGFDTLFRHSQLTTKIDGTETSILSNMPANSTKSCCFNKSRKSDKSRKSGKSKE